MASKKSVKTNSNPYEVADFGLNFSLNAVKPAKDEAKTEKLKDRKPTHVALYPVQYEAKNGAVCNGIVLMVYPRVSRSFYDNIRITYDFGKVATDNGLNCFRAYLTDNTFAKAKAIADDLCDRFKAKKVTAQFMYDRFAEEMEEAKEKRDAENALKAERRKKALEYFDNLV